MERECRITAIQRMSVHDGPGIRSTVFMKGCNFRCRWCHNPETWSVNPQIQFIDSKCIKCGLCVSLCPAGVISFSGETLAMDRRRCTLCGTCAGNCPSGAIRVVGKRYSPAELFDEVIKDKVFYDASSGGVTVSGGEPFLQSAFLKDFLRLCKENDLHTAVETNLSLSWDILGDFIGLVSLWMCDLKSADSAKHAEWTGAGNEAVIENLRKLSSSGVDILVRTPVIPGFNDTENDIKNICDILSGLENPVRYELIPFHTLGFGKFDDFGLNNPMSGTLPLSQERFSELKKVLCDYKFK